MRSGSESSAAPSDTLTLSPFSDSSLRSEPTSDGSNSISFPPAVPTSHPSFSENPDLGAFTAVFHTWNALQPLPRPGRLVFPSSSVSIPSSQSAQPDSTPPVSPSEYITNTSYHVPPHNLVSPSPELLLKPAASPSTSPPLGSPFAPTARPNQSVFSLDESHDHHVPDDYLSDTSSLSFYSAPPSDLIYPDSEGLFDLDSDVASHSSVDLTSTGMRPTLGQLDEALSFLAAEKAKWTAHQGRAELSSTALGKRRRRRKRPTTKVNSQTPRGAVTDVEIIDEDEAVTGGRSSSASSHLPVPSDNSPISTIKVAPAPHLSRREKRRLKQLANGTPVDSILGQVSRKGKSRPQLHQSRSVPQLRTPLPANPSVQEIATSTKHPNPDIEKLRVLVRKLIKLFPHDRNRLEALLAGTTGRQNGLAIAISSPVPLPVVDDSDTGQVSHEGDASVIDVRGPSPQLHSPIKRPSMLSGRGKGKQKDREKTNKGRDVLEGPPPERLIHVFVDHSNILIGLLSWLRRHPRKLSNLPPPPFPSHKRSQSSTTSHRAHLHHHIYHHHHLPHHFHTNGNLHSAIALNNNGQLSSSIHPQSLSFGNQPPFIHPAGLSSDSSGGGSVGGNMVAPFAPPNFSQPREPKPTNHLSHSALALILEHGRPITRRVMAASSPLYQPMEPAERLGYEVRIYMRVPDLGDGMDRERSAAKVAAGHSRSVSLGSASSSQLQQQQQQQQQQLLSNFGTPPKVQGNFPATLKAPNWAANRTSSEAVGVVAPSASSPQNGRKKRSQKKKMERGSVSNESDPVHSHSSSTPPLQHQPHASLGPSVVGSPPKGAGVGIGVGTGSNGLPLSPPKIKYREQGVDELLQLKLHQAIASADELPYPLPPGSTIVLATGDGNVGQFNEDGFLGTVRTALRRGWEVELYAWEVGLSKRWAKEFGLGKKGGEFEGRFRVIGLEQFAEDLVERSWW